MQFSNSILQEQSQSSSQYIVKNNTNQCWRRFVQFSLIASRNNETEFKKFRKNCHNVIFHTLFVATNTKSHVNQTNEIYVPLEVGKLMLLNWILIGRLKSELLENLLAQILLRCK